MSDLNISLLHAAGLDDQSLIKTLVQQGANVNADNRTTNINGIWVGDTPLKVACRAGLLENVKLLVKMGAKVDFKDHFHGSTVLMDAAFYSGLELVKFLVKQGADVNEQDLTGCTALMNAMYQDEDVRLSIIDFLVAHNADVNRKDNHNKSVFNIIDDLSRNRDMSDVVAYFNQHAEKLKLLNLMSNDPDTTEDSCSAKLGSDEVMRL